MMERLRLARLCRRYGLSMTQARLIATLAFGEGRNG